VEKNFLGERKGLLVVVKKEKREEESNRRRGGGEGEVWVEGRRQ